MRFETSIEQVHCFLSKDEAKALLDFADKNSGRPLVNVFFRPQKGDVLATNGHKLLQMRGPTDWDKDKDPIFSVDREHIERAVQMARKKANVIRVSPAVDGTGSIEVLSHDGKDGVLIGHTAASMYGEVEEKNCFSYWAVIPEVGRLMPADAGVAALNADLFKSLSLMQRAVEVTYGKMVIAGEFDPITFDVNAFQTEEGEDGNIQQGTRLRAFLMPVRP